MRAEDDDLVREIAARNIADDVGGAGLGQIARARAHLAAAPVCHSRTAARGHPRPDSRSPAQGFVVRWSCSEWRPCAGKRSLLVLIERITTPTAPSAAAAEGPEAAYPHGAAVSRAVASAIHPQVEKYDPVLHGAGRQRGEGIEILDHDGIRLDAFGARADTSAECERGHALRPGRKHFEIRFAPNPMRYGCLDGMHITESQPLHLPHGPCHRGLVAGRARRSWPDLGGEGPHQFVGGRVFGCPLAQRGGGRKVGARVCRGFVCCGSIDERTSGGRSRKAG